VKRNPLKRNLLKRNLLKRKLEPHELFPFLELQGRFLGLADPGMYALERSSPVPPEVLPEIVRDFWVSESSGQLSSGFYLLEGGTVQDLFIGDEADFLELMVQTCAEQPELALPTGYLNPRIRAQLERLLPPLGFEPDEDVLYHLPLFGAVPHSEPDSEPAPELLAWTEALEAQFQAAFQSHRPAHALPWDVLQHTSGGGFFPDGWRLEPRTQSLIGINRPLRPRAGNDHTYTVVTLVGEISVQKALLGDALERLSLLAPDGLLQVHARRAWHAFYESWGFTALERFPFYTWTKKP